jgi:3-oxoadipate enol-lactonase
MSSAMVSVDGGTVWADDSGGDWPPVVLLHPGVGDSRIWEPVLSPLTEHYRVIRYDARGFGLSPAPEAKFSLLRDLTAVLDYYGLERAAFVGCSQGGATALGFALDQPQRVSALVLLCPGIPGFPLEEQEGAEDPELDAQFERAHAAGDVDALALAMGLVWARAGSTPAVAEQLRSAARASIVTGDLELDDPPVFDRLGEIAVSTALVVGDADFPPLVEANRQAAARIPGCEFTFVPGMDHLPPLREPGLVLDVITRTLSRAPW